MNSKDGESSGIFAHYVKTWQSTTEIVHLDEDITDIRSALTELCESYLKKSSWQVNNGLYTQEVLKRTKILHGIQSLENGVKEELKLSLSLAIYLCKASEELFFHGLRSCQRCLVEIISTEKFISSIDKEIVSDVNVKSVLKKIDSLIGQYSKEYESVTCFLKRLDSVICNGKDTYRRENYCHPKFIYLQHVILTYFQSFPDAKAIIFSQSSFYMLEICNFLLKLHPIVKPMIYIEEMNKVKTSFSLETKNIVHEMFGSGQFNVLVRACKDIKYVDLEEVQLLVHFDVEQHCIKDQLYSMNKDSFNSNKVELLFSEKEIQKVICKKNVLTDLEVNRLEPNMERKRKISELNKSKSDNFSSGNKVKNIKLEDTRVEFDSLELDDRFFSKLDAEVGNKNSEEENSINLLFDARTITENIGAKDNSLNTTEGMKKKYYDLPLSVGDLSELNSNFKTEIEEENESLKISHCGSKKTETGFRDTENVFTSCISPILGKFSSRNCNLSSSTPIRIEKSRSCCEGDKKDEQSKMNETRQKPDDDDDGKNTDYCYVDFDLFEDWDVENCHGTEKKSEESKSLITISQAVELIEDTKKARESTGSLSDENSNESVDLLTGEVIRNKSETNLFAESFNLSKLELVERVENGENGKNAISADKSHDYSIGKSIIMDFGDTFEKTLNATKNKPTAAQKLNFENVKCDTVPVTDEDDDDDEDLFRGKSKPKKKTEIDSDDSLEAILKLSFFDKIKVDESKELLTSNEDIPCYDVKSNASPQTSNNAIDLTDDSLSLCKNRGKHCRIQETGSETDSPSERKTARKKGKKREKRQSLDEVTGGKDLLDLEAEVSEDDSVSSDEIIDEKDEYEKSFVDDNSYCTQNASAGMTTKYLESVKTRNVGPGTFKIPKQVPYVVEDVFSQIPCESNSEYEINSFCVNDIEYEEKELSDLEIAEQILEMERRNKKRKNTKKRK